MNLRSRIDRLALRIAPQMGGDDDGPLDEDEELICWAVAVGRTEVRQVAAEAGWPPEWVAELERAAAPRGLRDGPGRIIPRDQT